VDIFLLIVTVPILVSMLSDAFRGGADSPNWELRWRSLGPADRVRIANAAGAGTELDDPEEAELAAGFNRRRRRRSSFVEGTFAFLVVASTALSLVGLGRGFTGWALAIAGIGAGLWAWFGEKRLNAPSRVVAAPDTSL
jgi:hypothetical protein